MFSINNTMREIMETPLIGSRIGNLFPSCWIPCVKKEHWDHTMEQIKQEDTMEWGQPFWSEAFVECANILKETVDKKRFCFVPLWTERETLDFTGKYLPEAATNCEKDVWLFTGNPLIDQQAFAHTSSSASIPPYKSDAVLEEKKKSYKNQRPAVIFCPGGGYLCASEAYLYEELRELVLERLLEENKEDQELLKQRYHEVSARPDALGLLYPVISFIEDYHEGSCGNLTGGDPKLKEKLSVERHMDENYPPTYAFANEDDGCVPVSNTIRLDQQLQAAGVKHRCDIYPQGDHGIGLGYETSAQRWSEEMLKFLERK